jgi:response regulator RpfG family c-di-GMP phosphodiesterase
MNSRPTILLLDDEPVALELLGAALEGENAYHVATATTVNGAQRLAELHIPSLAIVDVNLKGENGLDFCLWMRRHSLLRDSLIVMLTGASLIEQKLRGFEAGADEYITKPFNPPELLSKVRALMRIKGMQDELKKDREELARLNGALGSMLDAATALLVNLISLRVPNAAARSETAAAFAQWIGERLELSPEFRRMLDLSAKLHEIGKIIMMDEVLSKSRSAWTEDDRTTVSQFPLFGQMIVAKVPQLVEVGHILRHQMENFDGTGLPDRLLREEIPIASRVLRIINAVQEERANGRESVTELIDVLRRGRGTMFDPHILVLAEEYLYAIERPSWAEGKRQLNVSQLEEGMVIAADLQTASGIKLLPADSTLSQSMIDRIRARHQVDPIINWVYIYGGTGPAATLASA